MLIHTIMLALLAGCTNQPATKPAASSSMADPMNIGKLEADNKAKVEKLLVDLQSQDAGVRTKAVKDLGAAILTSNDKELNFRARLSLIEAVSDPDAGVRFKASEAYLNVIPVDARSQIVNSSIKDNSVATLCFLLRHEPSPSPGELILPGKGRRVGKGKESQNVRLAATQSLARLGPLAQDAVPTLLEALNSEETAMSLGSKTPEEEREHQAVAKAVTVALQKIDADALMKERLRQEEEAATRLLESIVSSEGALFPSERVKGQLQTLIQKYPKTKAAAKARELVEQRE
jgi:hypothetical protein